MKGMCLKRSVFLKQFGEMWIKKRNPMNVKLVEDFTMYYQITEQSKCDFNGMAMAVDYELDTCNC